MILGETLLGQVINNILEKVCVSLIIWGSNKKLKIVVKKNLESHFSRNSKTSVMFSLCLAYIIFAAALFTLMGGSLSRQIEWSTGADISITANSLSDPLPEKQIRNIIENNLLLDEDLIEEYTFVTYPLSHFNSIVNTYMCPVSGIIAQKTNIYGVEPNILKTLMTKYYIVESLDYKYIVDNDPIASLSQMIDPQKEYAEYIPEIIESVNSGITTTKGKINHYYPLNATRTYTKGYPMLIGKNYITDTYSEMFEWTPLVIDGYDNDVSEVYLMKPIGILNKFPGFTGITTGVLGGEYVAFISMEHYEEFLNRTYQYLYEAYPAAINLEKYKYPDSTLKKHLFIKVSAEATDFQIEDIINNILRYIDDSTKYTVTNLRHSVKSTNSIAELLNKIFYFSKLNSIYHNIL